MISCLLPYLKKKNTGPQVLVVVAIVIIGYAASGEVAAIFFEHRSSLVTSSLVVRAWSAVPAQRLLPAEHLPRVHQPGLRQQLASLRLLR